MTTISHYDHIQLRSLDSTDEPDNAEFSIQVVPAYEADAASGRISEDAPVGKAVLHRKVGDTVTVLAQNRPIPMKIMAITKHENTACLQA